jgi:Flp pilus assembly protein TadD
MFSLSALVRLRWPLLVPLLASVVLLASVTIPTYGQGNGRAATGTGGNHIISGKIFFPSGRQAEGVVQVKLQSLHSAEISVIADSGSFLFPGLVPGNYTVVISAGDQFEIAREGVTIDSDLRISRSRAPVNSPQRRYTIMVTLQNKREQKNSAKPGVINASLAEVPENARQLYQKALDLIKAGDSPAAVENLRTAVSLYPQFPLALNELGVQYLKLGQATKAIEPLRSASRFSPDAFTPKLNLGIALLETKQFAEAETQLRDALKITATPIAHMYLGLTLLSTKRFEEAQQELETAITSGGGNLAQARKFLGGLYWQKRDYRRAVDEFEAYLRLTPNAPDAERVRATINELRAKS